MASIPAGFDAWFSRATAVEPARRFQSVTELATELRALAATASAERAPDAAGFALASTQRIESPGPGLAPAVTRQLETRTAADRWGASDVALSTTAHGGALSASQRTTASRGRSGRALLLGGFALIGVGVLGGALSGLFRRSEELPQSVSRALGSPAAEPVVGTPVAETALAAPVVPQSVVPQSAVPSAVLPSAVATLAPSTPSKKTPAAKSPRAAGVNARKAVAKRPPPRLDAYDIP